MHRAIVLSARNDMLGSVVSTMVGAGRANTIGTSAAVMHSAEQCVGVHGPQVLCKVLHTHQQQVGAVKIVFLHTGDNVCPPTPRQPETATIHVST